jgi:hypothetical protein
MPTYSDLRRVVASASAALLLLSACAKDTVINPVFGAGCDAGDIRPGHSIRSALNEDSCVESLNLLSYARSPYAGFGASLTKDKAYYVSMTRRPDPDRFGRNGLYPVLSLWGKDNAGNVLPLTISSGEARDENAEFFFVAERSGTHRLVASGYNDASDYSSLGGFELTLHECPMLGTLSDTGSTTFTLRDSECLRTGVARQPEYQGDIPAYNFVTVRSVPGEEMTITVTADDFTPAIEAFGPGQDTYDYLSYGDYASNVGEAPVAVYTGERDGRVTIAIGALDATGPSRRFTVRIQRAPIQVKD